MAAPKWCRPCPTCPPDQSGELAACETELGGYKPVVQAAVTASTRVGQAITVRVVVPTGTGEIRVRPLHGFWNWQEVGLGTYDVTFNPLVAGTARLSFDVLVNGQLLEYPVEITVSP